MAALELLLDAIDRTVAWLKLRQTQRDARMQEVQGAWGVLRDAVTRTRAYLADQRDPDARRDRAEERQIAAAWNAVGLVVKGLGGDGARELSDRCFAKADYWADPEKWDRGHTRELDIKLEAVESDIVQLLDPTGGEAHRAER